MITGDGDHRSAVLVVLDRHDKRLKSYASKTKGCGESMQNETKPKTGGPFT